MSAQSHLWSKFFHTADYSISPYWQYCRPLLSLASYLTISITHIVSSHLNVFDKSLRLGLLKAGDVFHWNPLQGSRCFPFHVNSPRNALSPLLSVLGCPPPACIDRYLHYSTFHFLYLMYISVAPPPGLACKVSDTVVFVL